MYLRYMPNFELILSNLIEKLYILCIYIFSVFKWSDFHDYDCIIIPSRTLQIDALTKLTLTINLIFVVVICHFRFLSLSISISIWI